MCAYSIAEIVNETGSYGSDEFDAAEESLGQPSQTAMSPIPNTQLQQQQRTADLTSYAVNDSDDDEEDDDRYGVKDYLNESRGSSEGAAGADDSKDASDQSEEAPTVSCA